MTNLPDAHDLADANFAPGSVVEVRDEEWLVTGMERASDGWFVDVTGLTGIVRDQQATFSTALDRITPRDPKHTQVVADQSPRFRTARLWLESMLRRTAIPISEPNLTVARQSLADPLPYQERAATLALSPNKLRPRILLADAVGLGKTIEIGQNGRSAFYRGAYNARLRRIASQSSCRFTSIVAVSVPLNVGGRRYRVNSDPTTYLRTFADARRASAA